jgi:hypothetical protein
VYRRAGRHGPGRPPLPPPASGPPVGRAGGLVAGAVAGRGTRSPSSDWAAPGRDGDGILPTRVSALSHAPTRPRAPKWHAPLESVARRRDGTPPPSFQFATHAPCRSRCRYPPPSSRTIAASTSRTTSAGASWCRGRACPSFQRTRPSGPIRYRVGLISWCGLYVDVARSAEYAPNRASSSAVAPYPHGHSTPNCSTNSSAPDRRTSVRLTNATPRSLNLW